MAIDEDASRFPQREMLLRPETKLYRALLSGKCIEEGRVTDKAFRLRPANADFPAETTLSVALTAEKAMGDLDCRGYTEIVVGDVERITGLGIQPKPGDDSDLFELTGIPLDDITAQNDYALALAKISGKVVRTEKKRHS